MVYRKNPLAATRRANFLDRMQRQRESMTGADVERAMEKVIRDRLDICEDITLEDFRRANLPMETVKHSFKRVMARVQTDAKGS